MVTWELCDWEVEVEENIMLKNKDTKDEQKFARQKRKRRKGRMLQKRKAPKAIKVRERVTGQ